MMAQVPDPGTKADRSATREDRSEVATVGRSGRLFPPLWLFSVSAENNQNPRNAISSVTRAVVNDKNQTGLIRPCAGDPNGPSGTLYLTAFRQGAIPHREAEDIAFQPAQRMGRSLRS